VEANKWNKKHGQTHQHFVLTSDEQTILMDDREQQAF
jgi:hypothetical protein